MARDIAAKDTRVIRAAKEALNLIDVQRVNSSYRMEQGFTFELNLAGVSDEHRDAFVDRQGPMSDKRTTLDEAVSELRDGMTIGIGGWGSRRKPMAFVRAILRTEVKDLTVVSYGGPDIGLLCSAGKVRRVYYGFVSLDSPPFYDPWFSKARTSGSIEAREMDEGMLRCGLHAAAQRLPFLPIRAGLGSSVLDFWEGELSTVTSPYPAPEGGYETLVAMPALRLDAAFVHLNLGDAFGNAAYTGIDPYFDDLYLMAAEQALPVGGTGGAHRRARQGRAAAGAAGEPDDGGLRRGGTRRRPLHHGRTGLRPRREVPAPLCRGGCVRRKLAAVRADVSVRQRGRLSGGGAQVRRGGLFVISVSRAEVCIVACAELFRDAGEIMVSPMTTVVSVGARLARLTFSPDILLTDGEAQLLADAPAIGAAGAVEGWMPFGRVFETLAWGRRHVVMGANQIDRYGNQNLSAFGPLQHPTRQMFGVRGAPGNTINHATSYWVGNHSRRVFCDAVDVVSGIGWDKVDPGNPAYRFVNVYRVVSNLGVFDFNGPDHQMRAVSLHPGIEPDQVRENTSFEVHGLDSADTTRLPTGDEQKLIREVIDPKSLRNKEVKV